MRCVQIIPLAIYFESEHMSCVGLVCPVLQRQSEVVRLCRWLMVPDIVTQFIVCKISA